MNPLPNRGSSIRVVRNTAILIALRVFMPACGLLLVLALSRQLGVDGLGRYSLVFSLFYFFNSLAPLGLSSIIVREGAKDRAAIEPILANALILSTCAGLVLTGAMAAAGLVLGYDAQTFDALLLLSLAIVPSAVGALFEGVFVALEKMQRIAATTMVEYLFKVGAALALLYLGYGLMAVLCMGIAGQVTACALGVWLLRREGIRVRWARDAETMQRLVRLAPTLVLIAAFASLYWRIDIVMLSKLQPLTEVGYYSAAYRVFELAVVIPSSFCLALYPSVAAAVHADQARLQLLGRSTMHYLVAFALPVAVCTSILCRPLLRLLYGADFAEAAPTLAILMWTLVFYGLVRYHAYVLLAANRQRVDLALNAAMALSNIALNFVLIPRYSHLGAALATLISIVAYGITQYWYLGRHFPGYAAVLSIPAIVPVASLALGAMVWWLQDMALLLVVPLAIALYGLLLLAGGFFTRADLSVLGVARFLAAKRDG